MKNLRILVLFIFLFSFLSNAVIYKIDVYAKDDHFIFALSDWHIDFYDLKITQQNRKDIADFAKALGKDTLVILEDDKTYAGKNPAIIKSFKKEDRLEYWQIKLGWIGTKIYKTLDAVSSMYGQTEKLKSESIDAISAENRNEEIASKEYGTVSLEDVNKAFEARLKEIFSYNDDKILNEIYKAIIDQSDPATFANQTNPTIYGLEPLQGGVLKAFQERIFNFIKELRAEKKLSIKDFIEKFAKKISNDEETIKNWINILGEVEEEYSLRHLDAKILHLIYQNRDRKNIILWAGGKHIETIGKDLEKLGYKHLKTIGHKGKTEEETVNFAKALDLKKEFQNFFKEFRK